MLLYHGSNMTVDQPDIIHSRRTLDFGQGFYVTSDRKQAEKFAGIIRDRREVGDAIVSVFEFDYENAVKEALYHDFPSANDEWLDFVIENRRGRYNGIKDDIIHGPVADDNVLPTIILFETMVLNRSQTIEALKAYKLFDQFAFCSNKALSFIKFTKSYMVEDI
jgi:hypothetical protein